MTNKHKFKIAIIFLSTFLISVSAYAQDGSTSVLGFEFGMSKDDAKKQIKSYGARIIKNDVDTKDIRTIVLSGTVSDIPLNSYENVSTELEFFDDKLMSSALVVKEAPDDQYNGYRDSILEYLQGTYGEPQNSEKMLSYRIWTWELENTRLVYSSNDSKNQLKVNYTFKPLNKKRITREIDEKRKGDDAESSPADQMFKDGNYSRPSNFPR